jgi:hypothetical protein
MTTIEQEASPAVKLPPGRRLPRGVQGVLALPNRRTALQRLRRIYGSAFTIDLPIFGQLVVISDPTEIRQLLRVAPSDAPGEGWLTRGVALAPSRGALVSVRRRSSLGAGDFPQPAVDAHR